MRAFQTRRDLVWYTNAAGVIQHVAIHLGDGKIVDALYSVRVRRDATVLNGYLRPGTVSRVFAKPAPDLSRRPAPARPRGTPR